MAVEVPTGPVQHAFLACSGSGPKGQFPVSKSAGRLCLLSGKVLIKLKQVSGTHTNSGSWLLRLLPRCV